MVRNTIKLTKQGAVKEWKADAGAFCWCVEKGMSDEVGGICTDNQVTIRSRQGDVVFYAELKAKIKVLRPEGSLHGWEN